MMKGYVLLLLLLLLLLSVMNFIHLKQKNRIVEPRRPGSFFIDTSLLGRIHTITDGRTTNTTTNTTTTTTVIPNSTYRDNPHHHLDSQVDLTMSKLNDVNATPPSSRRLR